MKVLVACEESQRVCIEFRRLGHEAYSCDIEPCSGGHEEWHIQQDVLPLLKGSCEFQTVDGMVHRIDGKWDMIIAFPPCTYLSNAGAKHLFKNHVLNEERYLKGLEAKKFFLQFLNADCQRICVENPVSSKIFDMPPHTMEIQPYQFGHPVQKKTRLWLLGLPELKATNEVDYKYGCHEAGTWFMKGGKDRQKNRSKTFPGIAKAMAEQWGLEELWEVAEKRRAEMNYIMAEDFEEKKAEAERLMKARNRAAALIKDAKARYVKEKTRAKSRKAALEKDEMLKSPRFKALDIYDEREDIMEHYGWDGITESEKDRLEALWDEREELKKSSNCGIYEDGVTEILDAARSYAETMHEDRIEEYEELERAFRKQQEELEEESRREHEDYKAWKNGWGKYAPESEG